MRSWLLHQLKLGLVYDALKIFIRFVVDRLYDLLFAFPRLFAIMVGFQLRMKNGEINRR